LGTGAVSSSDFKFYNSSNTAVNWPIMMVVVTEWLNNAVAANSTTANTVSYTRDTAANIPSNLNWVGSCDNGTDFDKTSCVGSGATWTPQRTNFSGAPLSIPGTYAALFGIQEDIMIREFVRYAAAESTADGQSDPATQMQNFQVLEKAYADALDIRGLTKSGTNPAGTVITTAQKKALVKLLKSPQF